MLQRIELVQGIGLLHEARGAGHRLQEVSLIYAGNGRGKSTLSSVLRSASASNPSFIEERRTIDGTLDPQVVLQFDSGHKVKYLDGKWSERRPEIVVFDTAFIDSNVHSGGQVSTEHRKNLLDFAIGDRAVASRKREEQAVTAQQKASAEIARLKKQIAPYSDGMPHAVFKNLANIENAEAELAELDKRRTDAMRSKAILEQPLPNRLLIPDLRINELFHVLRQTLDDVHAQAEEIVSQHMSGLKDQNSSTWLSQGQQYDNGATCPYCGQITKNISLIRMYQTHFNETYKELHERVRAAAVFIETVISENTLHELFQQRDLVANRLAAWRPYVQVGELSGDQDDLARSSISNLHSLMQVLFLDKGLVIAEESGTTGDKDEACRLEAQLGQIITDQNDLIDTYRAQIERYMESLQAENVAQLEKKISEIKLAVTRNSQSVVDLFEELDKAEASLKDAEKEKEDARVELKHTMSSTLRRYKIDINKHLTNLGAAFEIDEIGTNFYGQSARSDYGLKLRGKPVRLAGGNPSFDTALSEGDKRTLAFAFFVASTLSDPDISNRIIVIDDPVSSLDRSRREYTSEVLLDMAVKCSQLIVLAHDAVFLKSCRSAFIRKPHEKNVFAFQISRVVDNYSGFDSLDLDKECETPYFTNYRKVDEFVSGKGGSMQEAAIAIRPLLEGYLHRRFPGKVPADLMLGQVLAEIGVAEDPSPLVHASELVSELQRINGFAGRFHHDTNPNFTFENVDSGSVVAYGKRALDVIHGSYKEDAE
ncbi:AAA family ATPase [Arthrobacter sp. RIT-PI-e]|uniref:AAA family ATPase n=1 Tax=Arthrobacter sp. RIT-PI-e TaxID=1681197 RepID=UPI0009E1EDA1|nr:AAA family ATPase [Arthrobacter sp. RIT-PI-e]